MWFRKQDNLTNNLQKELILRIGQLSGRPSTSGLHIHPVLNTEGDVNEQRDPDQEISTISSKLFTKIYGRSPDGALAQVKQSAGTYTVVEKGTQSPPGRQGRRCLGKNSSNHGALLGRCWDRFCQSSRDIACKPIIRLRHWLTVLQIRLDQWHSDIAFEPVPADFSSLRLAELPKTGGGRLQSLHVCYYG